MSIDGRAIDLAVQWLTSGQAPVARAQEVARAMLVRDGQLPWTAATARQPFGADVEAALLRDAEAHGNVELAAALADHAADKDTSKAAKKLLFRFKQRGLSVPDRTAKRVPLDLSARPDPLPSFLSAISDIGSQFCVLGGWKAGVGPTCLLGFFDEAAGLRAVYFLPSYSRTAQREMLTRMRAMVGEAFEAPSALVAGRMRFGLDTLDSRGGSCEGDLAEARQALEGVDPVAEVGFEVDPEDEARFAEHVAASFDLDKESVFRAFDPAGSPAPRPAPLAADAPAEAVAEAANALLRDYIEHIGALSLAGRFEFNAWLLASQGRKVAALQALACARALRDGAERWPEVALLHRRAEAVLAKLPVEAAAAALAAAVVP